MKQPVSKDLERLGHLAEVVLWKAAAIPQKDLRYWGDVQDAVDKKIRSMPPEEQVQAKSGKVSVVGACGHSIRQGDNGVTVEIGKDCFTCSKANAPLLKSGSILELFGGVELEKSAVIKQDADTGKWILWTRDGKRKLGTHDTPEEAHSQEYAIQKSQEREKSASEEHPYGVKCAVCGGRVRSRNRGKQPCYYCENGHQCDDGVDAVTGELLVYDDKLGSLSHGIWHKDDPRAQAVDEDRLAANKEWWDKDKKNTDSEREKSASAEETAQDLMKRPCCGSGCENCPYEPRYQKGNTKVRAEFKKSASPRSAEIQQLLDDSDIPADVYFYTDGKDRATVCLGDWHDDTVSDIALQFGRSNWDQWEDPDDTEIGRPSWHVKTLHARREPVKKSAAIAAHLRRARNATHTDPTPAQASAGNYAKGELQMHGMTVKLENPKGTTRRGYKPDGSIAWERVMTADYGYFKGTKAVDGDAIDCFIGSDPDSEMVVAIDQYRGDTFDETKFVLGVRSQDEGTKLYLSHYPKGWRLGPVSTTTVQQLREWLKGGQHKKPFKGQLVKTATVGWIG